MDEQLMFKVGFWSVFVVVLVGIPIYLFAEYARNEDRNRAFVYP